jgi:hypothetical protein
MLMRNRKSRLMMMTRRRITIYDEDYEILRHPHYYYNIPLASLILHQRMHMQHPVPRPLKYKDDNPLLLIYIESAVYLTTRD